MLNYAEKITTTFVTFNILQLICVCFIQANIVLNKNSDPIMAKILHICESVPNDAMWIRVQSNLVKNIFTTIDIDLNKYNFENDNSQEILEKQENFNMADQMKNKDAFIFAYNEKDEEKIIDQEKKLNNFHEINRNFQEIKFINDENIKLELVNEVNHINENNQNNDEHQERLNFPENFFGNQEEEKFYEKSKKRKNSNRNQNREKNENQKFGDKNGNKKNDKLNIQNDGRYSMNNEEIINDSNYNHNVNRNKMTNHNRHRNSVTKQKSLEKKMYSQKSHRKYSNHSRKNYLNKNEIHVNEITVTANRNILNENNKYQNNLEKIPITSWKENVRKLKNQADSEDFTNWPPWTCKFTPLWIDMGEDILPRQLKTGSCIEQATCMSDLYECKPITYQVPVLKRILNPCKYPTNNDERYDGDSESKGNYKTQNTNVLKTKKIKMKSNQFSNNNRFHEQNNNIVDEEAWVHSIQLVVVSCECSIKRKPGIYTYDNYNVR